jgi:hypothetical protein
MEKEEGFGAGDRRIEREQEEGEGAEVAKRTWRKKYLLWRRGNKMVENEQKDGKGEGREKGSMRKEIKEVQTKEKDDGKGGAEGLENGEGSARGKESRRNAREQEEGKGEGSCG